MSRLALSNGGSALVTLQPQWRRANQCFGIIIHLLSHTTTQLRNWCTCATVAVPADDKVNNLMLSADRFILTTTGSFKGTSPSYHSHSLLLNLHLFCFDTPAPTFIMKATIPVRSLFVAPQRFSRCTPVVRVAIAQAAPVRQLQQRSFFSLADVAKLLPNAKAQQRDGNEYEDPNSQRFHARKILP